MSREVLARLLDEHTYRRNSIGKVICYACPDAWWHDLDGYAGHLADLIEADGYRKVRTIASAVDFDALPTGTLFETWGHNAGRLTDDRIYDDAGELVARGAYLVNFEGVRMVAVGSLPITALSVPEES